MTPLGHIQGPISAQTPGRRFRLRCTERSSGYISKVIAVTDPSHWNGLVSGGVVVLEDVAGSENRLLLTPGFAKRT